MRFTLPPEVGSKRDQTQCYIDQQTKHDQNIETVEQLINAFKNTSFEYRLKYELIERIIKREALTKKHNVYSTFSIIKTVVRKKLILQYIIYKMVSLKKRCSSQ